MTAWVLFICIGSSSWGCGAIRQPLFPDAASCYAALEHMRTGDQPIAESNAKRNTVAYCAPKGKE